jgi:hypothetical protein
MLYAVSILNTNYSILLKYLTFINDYKICKFAKFLVQKYEKSINSTHFFISMCHKIIA